jgi:hypothetical protein
MSLIKRRSGCERAALRLRFGGGSIAAAVSFHLVAVLDKTRAIDLFDGGAAGQIRGASLCA